MHDTGCLGLVHWDYLVGWYGEGGGRRVQEGEHMYTCDGFIKKKIITSLNLKGACIDKAFFTGKLIGQAEFKRHRL